jgi:Arc/MetJ-type ribon-helix-helix transcriptional regulator
MSEQDSSEGYDRITVSMPRGTAAGLRAAVSAGAAPSLSALVSEAVADRLARDEVLRRINELRGGEPLPEHALAWARKALGVDEPDARTGRIAS